MTRRLGTIRAARELPDGPLDPPEEPRECEPEPYAPPWGMLEDAIASIDVGLGMARRDEDRSVRGREWRAEVLDGLVDECDALAAVLREAARRMRG